MSEKACAGCGTANEADARFCEGCGAEFDRRCAACGTQASATARFCRSCGGSLDRTAQPPQSPGPTRKTVTVLFADLAGSTTFEEKVDAETAREVMGQYHTLLRQVAEHHRAGVTKYIGDGFMAVWGVPEISATDAEHAVEAAVELQERFVGLAARVAETHQESLALRVAVNTGEVVVGSGDADLVGDALNVAARLESQCPLGHVIVGEETWRATRGRHRYEPLNSLQVKGRAAPVAVFQWAGQSSEPSESVPFVGRVGEFRRLQTVLEDAVARRTARLVTVIGDPGVGKTRLAAEFAGSQQGAVVLQIRCAAEGTVALAPVVEALRARDLEQDLPAAVPERDRILRDLNGMTGGVAGSVEETFWALRRYFEVLAGSGQLILLLDDVHWADSLLVDFVEHLSEWVRDVPILMVALARPELRETRPELVTVGASVGDAIRLGGLEPAATAELAARVLGSDQLPADLLARLPSSTGGNPLFVRELVAMLVHDGVLVAQPNGWRLTIDVDAIAVPPTIQALLASRLERINTADRRVLETASVIGTDFSPAAVCALSGASPVEVRASLDRMRRLELAQPSGAYSGDEPVWRFHHILIRDVAYRRLLKSDRADLHERFAGWVRVGGQAGVFESDELLARHLESAYGYRCELGARDSATAELALQSARCYLSAARRALDRDALVSAGAQAARGAALATADPALRADLLLVGCEAYLSAGDVAAGAPLVEELDRIADAALAPWATCYRCQYIVYTDPSRLPEVDERIQQAIDEFARRGDSAGSAKAYRVRAGTRGRLGRIGEAEADLFEALIAARQCGDHRQITAALGAAPNAALWGPSPAPKAGGRCLDVVRMQRMTTAAPSLEATSLRCLSVLELLRGRPDKARSMLADAREIVSELGLRHGLMETELYAGIIESMAGDPVAAEPHFRTALEGLDSLGVGADAGQAAALLARSLLAQGRIDEADRYAAESERIAGHNLKTAIGWRAARAEILCAQGRHQEAVSMARDAVEVAADTDLVLDYADACLTLSRVLAAAGDRKGAADSVKKAELLYAAKDAVLLMGVDSVPAARAPEQATPASRLRLTTANRASDVPLRAYEGTIHTSDAFVYEDRRQVSGEPLDGGVDLHAAAKRKLEQYPHVEAPVLAARGDGLALVSLRWWDDAGNQSASLDLFEVNEAGELEFHGRFDEDDFAGAYRVLNERYYRGEGAAFAANGVKVLEFEEAFWAQDTEAARPTVHADFRWCAAASALKPGERSLDELFAWRSERLTQVASFQDCLAAVRWLSPDVCISLCEIRGTGHDGEAYRWNRFYVSQHRHGLSASVREFDIADEDEAFAYAESLVAREHRRLVVRNRASAVADSLIAAISTHQGSAAAALFAEPLTYDDRRRLSGNAVTSRQDYFRSLERLLQQYNHFDNQTLAVRGQRSALVSSRMSDASGNEAAYLHVFEIDERGLICYEGRFDEEDFAGAYRVLEERYYAGEGAASAAGGLTQLGFQRAIWAQDVEAARLLVHPGFVWEADPSTLKPGQRSLDEMFSWRAERLGQVGSFEDWLAVLQWLSPEVCVVRVEMEGEDYRWPRICVTHFRDGLLVSGREFDVADEEAAFAYAESLLARERSRLVVRNRASAVADGIVTALRGKDAVAAAAFYSEDLSYDDRRRLGGNPVTSRQDGRHNAVRMIWQYSTFEHRTLAVRGERSALVWSRFSDIGGNESTHLHVFELDDQGLIAYEGRFDEDEFLSAYLELDRRYYAVEGAEFAESGMAASGWVEGIGRRDIDMVRRFSTPDFRWIAAPSSLKAAERTVEGMFEWLRGRGEQVTAQSHWQSVIRWVSPACVVGLIEVSAVGPDGAEYRWNYIDAAYVRDGRVAWVREFDTEAEAFAFAESVAAKPMSRLATTNRASAVGQRLIGHVRSGDVEAASDCYADSAVYDDRRRISGESVAGRADIRAAIKRITEQFQHFEFQTLAVRGERLHLARTRWSDAAGNESIGLILAEVDDDGRIIYDGRFDEDDFETAYLEMERRNLAGEGEPFAEAADALTKVLCAESSGDLDAVFSVFAMPGLSIESRSRSVFPTRTPSELRRGVEELRELVGAYRVWVPAAEWLSPEWVVARHQRETVGDDGQLVAWSRIYVTEIRNGLLQSVCEFDADTDGEEQAFAYAEGWMRATAGRLAVSNRASEVRVAGAVALQNGDLDTAASLFSAQVVLEDRRRISGEPPVGGAGIRAALEKLRRDYSQFGGKFLAVRGDSLVLARYVCSDEEGNQTSGLSLTEVGPDGRVIFEVRFDEDDFENAFLELERRYYAGEGAAFAEAGTVMTDLITSGNRGDNDKVFELFDPGVRVESRSRTIIPSRTLSELRSSVDEFKAMVHSSRIWYAAVNWLSPTCAVVRHEREAIGLEGQKYEWSRIYALEIHDGRFTAGCEFDIEFEDQAFAYAEERMRATGSRLAVSNRASVVAERLARAIRRDGDLESALAQFSEDCLYEDRRRFSGDAIASHSERRAALERIVLQYGYLEMTPVAVRGDRLVLERCRRSDDSGNESCVLVLGGIDDHDRLIAYIAFDEDDFEGAYRELEHRYYTGEGAPFAAGGMRTADFVTALSKGGVEEAIRLFNNPGLRFENRSRALFGDRSTSELRNDLTELVSIMSAVRWWYSAVSWPSPNMCVARQEREATGADGERYAWTDIYAAEFRGDTCTWSCRFDPDDEEQAFAAAEERMLLGRSRLAVCNRASAAREACTAAIRHGDIDAAAALYSDRFEYQDHRRPSGESPAGRIGIHAAFAKLRDHYNHFGGEFLAVRGDHLALGRYDCSDDTGNQTSGLILTEIDEAGLIRLEARFDEDDFESAYAEMERRFYAGEGAQFAANGVASASYVAAVNRGDFETAFAKFVGPDLRIESRAQRSGFAVQSATEYRSSFEELERLVGSFRDWFAAVEWVSPNWAVIRYQRVAVGRDSLDCEWDRFCVCEVREGRLSYICDFDGDDEEAAFAYAEERARATASRLPLTNRASEAIAVVFRELSDANVDAVVACFAEEYVRGDWRRILSSPLRDRNEMRSATERMLQQYNHFQWRALAVRGNGLVFGWSRWSDASGNASTYLIVGEVDNNGHITYEGRFDEDDFDSAYHELERRFFAGEGEEFAANGDLVTAFIEAMNRPDLDAARKSCLPSFRVVSPATTLATEDRSLTEFYNWIARRAEQVPSVRHWRSVNHWLSNTCVISRIEIQALSHTGDKYSWPRLAVAELSGGLLAHIRQFDLDDEEAAFAYADEIVAKQASRLPSTNQSSDTAGAIAAAFQAADVETVVDCYAQGYVFDDRRRLSGDPVRGEAALRAATEGILKQFDTFEFRGLAIRGDRLSMGWTRWSDSAGNETCYLHVMETNDEGRLDYAARFDEDNFAGAYAELERRYYAGEGAVFAENGLASANYVAAMNCGEWDLIFGSLTLAEMRVENRSRSAFPHRTTDELRRSFEDLHSMVSSVRTWFSAITWISHETAIARMEREAVGLEGEEFAWSHMLVTGWRQGRLASICEFDADDVDGAFAYAESIE